MSLRRPGFAILHYEAGRMTLVNKTHVDNKKAKKTHGEYLRENGEKLVDLIKDIARDFPRDNLVLVRERGFSRFAAETQALSKMVGVTDFLAAFLLKSFEEIPPVTIKKTLTGNAKAKKEEVAAALTRYVGEQTYACDDESDAVAVGIAWLILNGYIEAGA